MTRKSYWKAIRRHLALALTLTGLAGTASAVIVGPAGYTNAITAVPAVGDFSTRDAGGGGPGAFTSAAVLDAAIQTNTAASINTGLGSSSTYPPSSSTVARYNSNASGGFLQTKPTGSVQEYIALMATLVNNTGSNVQNLIITYDVAAFAGGAEEVPGHRVFYSMSGLADSWTLIDELSGLTISNTVTATVSVGTWNNGTTLYLLWIDDNNAASDDAYTINNFSIGTSGGSLAPPSCTVTTPANGALLSSSQSITAAASISGGLSPYSVEFFISVDGGAFASAGTVSAAPYEVNLGVLPMANYQIYAVVTDNTSATATSAINSFAVILPGIPVGASGSGVQDFSTRPPSLWWSTLSAPTDDNSTVASLDGRVNTNSASLITARVGDSSPNNPPAQNALAQWTSGGSAYLQTLPTGNGHTLLMATLYNTAAEPATRLTVAYNLAQTSATTVEQVPGHRVYYSLSGQPGTWTPIDAIDGNVGAKSALFLLGAPWPVSTVMYILWADDNGDGATDRGYQIDDISFTPGFGSLALTCTLSAPADGQVLAAPASVTLVATTVGDVPATSVSFYTNDVLFSTVSSAPYSALLSDLPTGAYAIYAVAVNASETAYSATNTITVVLPGIAVGATGSGVQEFSSAPPAYQWSTVSVLPSSTTAIGDIAGLDAAVATNAVSQVNAPLAPLADNPLGTHGAASWHSTRQLVWTRPTGNSYTLLMATLRNETGGDVGALNIAYAMTSEVPDPTNSVNETPGLYGQRVYYRVAGASTWQPINALSIGTETNYLFSTNFNVQIALNNTWAPNTLLYLLWADDNGPSSDSGVQREGAYTIDSLSVRPLPRLSIVNNGGSFGISWSGAGVLQKTSALVDPAEDSIWTDVPGASPVTYTPLAGETALFFRLRP